MDALPQDVFDDFEAQDIQNLQPEAVDAFEPEEFALLSVEALAGFTKENVDALNEAVLEEITPEELAAMNPDAIKNSTRPGYIFTNLDSDFISVDQVKEFLPEGWEVDDNTGEFAAPEGESLTYRAFDDSFTAPPIEQAIVADSVDLSRSFSLGGTGGKPANTLMNEGLQQTKGISNIDLTLFALNQDETGAISIEGSGSYEDIDFNFMASTDNIDQAPADTPVGLGQDEGGFFTMTAPNHHRFTLTPSPDVTGLVSAIDTESTGEIENTNTGGINVETNSNRDICNYTDQKVKLNSAGDVLMQLPESSTRQARAGNKSNVHVVGIFNAFKESAPKQYCQGNQCNWASMPDNLKKGVHFSNKLRDTRARQKAYVVYDDGTSQTFYPTVLYPDKFEALIAKIEGVEKIVYQTNGGFKAIFKGSPVLLYPTFDTTATELKKDEQVKPSVKLKQDGTFSYSIQDCSRLISTTVVLEQS